MVLFRLKLIPNIKVVESGTGSGSLSISLTKAILPNGHLFTYEFNENRASKAAEDFKRLGLSDNITVNHKDVLNNGFILHDKVTKESIDAVFLDLPSPQNAVQHAYLVLKKRGRVCNFSPCIE